MTVPYGPEGRQAKPRCPMGGSSRTLELTAGSSHRGARPSRGFSAWDRRSEPTPNLTCRCSQRCARSHSAGTGGMGWMRRPVRGARESCTEQASRVCAAVEVVPNGAVRRHVAYAVVLVGTRVDQRAERRRKGRRPHRSGRSGRRRRRRSCRRVSRHRCRFLRLGRGTTS